MKFSCKLSAVCATLCAGLCFHPSLAQTWRAEDVASGIGAQTHIRYQNTAYGDIIKVGNDLEYLGITAVRDLAIPEAPELQARYVRLASAGIRFCFTVRGDIPQTIARIESFARAHPQAVLAIEGPNEIDHTPVTYNGLTGRAGGAAYQGGLYDSVKSSTMLRDIPVYALDDFPASPDKADFGNTHPYPQRGRQPYDKLASAYASEARKITGKPVVFTEAGYFTKLGHVAWGGVNENTHAKLTLNLMLDALALGVKHTSLYELLDEGGSDKPGAEAHFGLFRADHQPKPAAVAVHNMIALLRDRGKTARTFALRSIHYELKGLPATAKTLLIEKSDGTNVIVLWNEAAIWDALDEKEIVVLASNVTLRFDTRVANARLYDPLRGEAPVRSYSGTQAIDVPLSDRAVFLVVSAAK